MCEFRLFEIYETKPRRPRTVPVCGFIQWNLFLVETSTRRLLKNPGTGKLEVKAYVKWRHLRTYHQSFECWETPVEIVVFTNARLPIGNTVLKLGLTTSWLPSSRLIWGLEAQRISFFKDTVHLVCISPMRPINSSVALCTIICTLSVLPSAKFSISGHVVVSWDKRRFKTERSRSDTTVLSIYAFLGV